MTGKRLALFCHPPGWHPGADEPAANEGNDMHRDYTRTDAAKRRANERRSARAVKNSARAFLFLAFN